MSSRPLPSESEARRAEHLERQARVRAFAEERGYDAVLAWARGGSSQDHYADVLYLTGYYSHQPFVSDLANPASPGAWLWRAAGHAAVVLPTDGPVVLVTEEEPAADPAPAADRVEVASDVAGAVATVLRQVSGDRTDRPFRVAVVGGEALAGRWERALLRAGPTSMELRDADEIAWAARVVKSPAEQALLRAAGAVGARAMDVAMAAAVPGARECEVAAAFVAELMRGGGAWYGGGVSSGPCADRFAPAAGLNGTAPATGRLLCAGDLLRIDAYGSVGGYLFDFARTRAVGAAPTHTQRILLDAVQSSVLAGIDMLRPGVTLGAVARRCEAVLASSEYARLHGVPTALMGGAWGHGLGLAFEPPWIMTGSGVVVEAGMCLALERRISAPGAPAGERGAQYEDNVLVTDHGAELLTPAARYE